jgi:hypothetical protein
MKDPLAIDLQAIRLEEFQHMLENKDLLPSRKILLEEIHVRFQTLAAAGIKTMDDLWQGLKTSKKVVQVAESTGVPQEYLTILRREVGSYLPRPVKLAELPGVSAEEIEMLRKAGIGTNQQLLLQAAGDETLVDLARRTGVPQEMLLEMVRLSDLCRIIGVGPVFARILLEAGIESVHAFVNAQPEKILERVDAVIEAKQYVQASVTINDIQYCLESARLLPLLEDH